MFIEPNSTIKLLHNVPLDPTYDHTVFFEYADQQTQWFDSFVKTGMVFDRQSYQRHSRGYIKLEVLADDVYDCNYVMFRNTSFGNKWFYGFVTNVEYINNNVTLIQYEIDVMQTWFFDYALGECFVEREHSDTDQVGDNIIPENLPTGEMQYASMENLLYFDANSGFGDALCAVVAAPFDKDGDDANGTLASGMYSGLRYNVFVNYSENGVYHSILDQLMAFFNKPRVATRADQIVTMFYYFKEFAVQRDTTDTPNRYYNFKTVTVPKDRAPFKNDYADPNSESYVPRNNKLYTAPYNYITVTDFNGNSMDYMYEFFTEDNCTFYVCGGLSAQPAVGIIPKRYMGNGYYMSNEQTYNGNPDYTFWYRDFPKIPWNTDGFIAYLAQTGVALLGSATVDLATLGANAITGFKAAGIAANPEIAKNLNAASILDGKTYTTGQPEYLNYSGGNIAGTIKGIMSGAAVAAYRGRRAQGAALSVDSWTINNIKVSAVHKKIRADYARMVDDYFSMFGYACNKVKIPHRNVRDRWTYVKTQGCVLAENRMPADDARKVCSIYNNGITFWTWYATVGDYTQDNPCRAEMIEP